MKERKIYFKVYIIIDSDGIPMLSTMADEADAAIEKVVRRRKKIWTELHDHGLRLAEGYVNAETAEDQRLRVSAIQLERQYQIVQS